MSAVPKNRRLVAGLAVFALIVSGLAVTAFQALAAGPGIVISEIHYHAGSDLDTDDFIELSNTSGDPVDLSGWTFTAGITATLPAGTSVAGAGRFVLSPDAARFQTLYGFAPDAIYTGKLSNGGEEVAIADAAASLIDTVTYADADPWPSTPDGAGPSLELRSLTADNSKPANWGASTVSGGTPRAVNSLDGTAPPPVVEALTATPQRPAPGTPVVVSAQLAAGSTAQLTYKIMFGADVSIAMLDDAASPGGAGDGVYAASIPGQAAGQLIRYRVDASNGGVAFSAPAASDSIRYQGVTVTNPSAASNLPVIEWFMPDAAYNDILANHRCDDVSTAAVIAYNGTVYDGVSMKTRGQSSCTAPKVSWKVEMAPGHDMDFRPYMPYLLDEWALQRDPDPVVDVAWQAVHAADARDLAITPIRTQRNGQFWSVGHFMETEDGTWREAEGVKDWSIYKGDAGGLRTAASPAALAASLDLDKKTRDDEDQTDVWNLTKAVDAPVSTSQRQWLEQNVNIPEVINYMAVNGLIRHQDSGWRNWFVSRDTEGTGRWDIWHWDVNWTFTTPAVDNKGTFLTPEGSNQLLQAIIAQPEYQQMYYRRLRTLIDAQLGAGRFEAQWDAIADQYTADWALEQSKWGLGSKSSFRTAFTNGLADRRNTFAANTGAGKPIPASQSATPNVVINELNYNPGANPDAEYVELTNPGSEAVDLSGWTLDGLGLTIQPGTVLLPGQQLVFVAKDTTFRAAYPQPGVLVGGQYPGRLSDTGQTVRLLQGTRVVDTVSYGTSDPWPAAANGAGSSLALRDPASDNSLPASWVAGPSGGTPGLANDVTPPPAGALIAETFTGADGSAWPAARWTTSASAGSATVQGNAGQLANTNTSGAYARAVLSGLADRADTDVTMSYRWSATTGSYVNVFSRGSGGWANAYRPRNGYGIELNSGSATVTLNKVSAGAVTTLQSVPSAQAVSTAKQWLRLRVAGSTIQFKTWLDGQAEPAAWRATVTDTAITTPGQLHLAMVRGSAATGARSVSMDDVVVSAPASTPPAPDTTAPSVPAGLTATAVGQTTAAISWQPSTDDAGVTGYQVLRDGVQAGTTASASFADSGLTAGTAYSYTVKAVDAAGNVSTASAALPVTTTAAPGGGALFSSAFSGADGASWPTGWTTSAAAGGVANLQGNAGRLAFSNTSGSYARAQLTGLAARADSDVTFSYQWRDPAAKGYLDVTVRGSGGWSGAYRAASGYTLELSSNSASAVLKKTVGGTTTDLLSLANAQAVTAAKQWVRLRAAGSTIQVKTWADGQAEPSAWRSTVTDTSVTAAGQVFLSYVRSSTATAGRAVDIDDLSVSAG